MSDEPRDGASASRRGRGDSPTPAAGVPLDDSAFPGFDEAAVPPRPPLPADRREGDPLDTADHTAIRDQWRAARDEFGSHVSHAREQLDQANERIKQRNERIKQRTGRDLILAIGIGVAFGAALLASLLFDKVYFVPLALAAALLGVYELTLALRGAARRVDLVPQLIATALVVVTAYFVEPWLVWVLVFVAVVFVVVCRLIGQMAARDGRTYGDVLEDAVAGGLVQVYVPFLAAVALILLRQEGGQWWVLGFIAIAVAADTGAYASGLAFGRHPMAPRISPKKTWEGFAGAAVASIAAGVLLAIFLLEIPWWWGAVFGVVIHLTATLGDLAESMLKRDIGIKDMSSFLPGHGGLLDRLDSILPSTVPALCLYFLLSPWVVL
ncbi:phosphatidate cytidylyltransferase [Microbacterium sp. ZW T5_45]|uniref:phosphatidate cytidylyltransferase n=1 Tax=Microbacterium sp. ZW T5_45 TaxID=3378080 RepID=UPI003854E7DE